MNSEPPIPLFSWEDIPGHDNLRLIEYLKKKNYQLDGVKIAKLDDGSIIKLTADKNYFLLSLNNQKTEVHILIDYDNSLETKKWNAQTENDKLNVYPLNYKSGTWTGDFMEGTWCGTSEWKPSGKWEGKGRWESGKLNGKWIGKGKWSKDDGNDYKGNWNGSGKLWEDNVAKLGSNRQILSAISIIGTAVSAIGTVTVGILGEMERKGEMEKWNFKWRLGRKGYLA